MTSHVSEATAAQKASSSAPRGILQNFFWGPNGVRALWRFLLFVIVLFSLQYCVSLMLHGRKSIPEFTPRAVMLGDGVQLLIVLAATLVMARIEKRSLAIYGLPLRGGFVRRLIEGTCWGFLAQSTVMLMLFFTGNATLNGLDQHGLPALYLALMWAAAFLLVGLFEESLFRGYVQFTLGSGMGFWPTAIILSSVFGYEHLRNPGETWLGGLTAVVMAMTFCTALRFTGNLWFAIGLHTGWDWTQTYFFGVPDSGMLANGHLLKSSLHGSQWITGGTAGPEGSVLELIVALVMIGLLSLRFNKRELS